MSTEKHRRQREEKNRMLKEKLKALDRSLGIHGVTLEKYQVLLSWMIKNPWKVFLQKYFKRKINYEEIILQLLSEKYAAKNNGRK